MAPIPAAVRNRARAKVAAVLGAVLLVIAGCAMWAGSLGPKEDDAIEACNARMLGIIDEASRDDIGPTSANEYEPTGGTYGKTWNVSGVVRTDYLTGIEREVEYSCTIYLDSTGQEMDGEVAIDF